MIFHVRVCKERGFAPKHKSSNNRPEPEWELSYRRLLAGFAILIIPLASSFLARTMDWDDGATAMLHLTEIAFGGLTGIIFGEKLAIGDARQK